MNGCEKSDEMISYYNIFESKTLKCWKRFFSNFFFFFFFKSDKDKCLFLSHDEGTTKISSQKLKKALINKLSYQYVFLKSLKENGIWLLIKKT